MKAIFRFLRQLLIDRPTFYRVTRDGCLSLDRDALFKSGQMARQFEAAREMKYGPTR